MRKGIRLVLCAGALLLAAGAAKKPKVEPDVAPMTVREDVFPRHPVRFPGGVIAYPDLEYANLIGYRPLLLDLYRPASASRRPGWPLVVWIHGGGWSRGDSRTSAAIVDYPSLLASLASRGFIVASINYRLSGEARFPAQVQDVKAAIRYLRANANRYDIDPERVMLWGGSAGGHLAALAATTCGLAAFDPQPSTGRLPRAVAETARIPPVSDCVQGAVIWYGLFDLRHSVAAGARQAPSGSSNVLELLGCEGAACESLAAQASPLTHASAATPPMLLIHGMGDLEAAAPQSSEMAERLRKAGAPVETLFIPEVGHGFIGTSTGETRAATHQALERTFAFFEKTAASVK